MKRFFKRLFKIFKWAGIPVYDEMEEVGLCEDSLYFTHDFLSWVDSYYPYLIAFPVMQSYFYGLCHIIEREKWARLLSEYGHPVFLAFLEYSIENENWADAADLRDCLAIHNLTLKEPLPSTLKEALKSR